jgi:kynurenine formamidase
MSCSFLFGPLPLKQNQNSRYLLIDMFAPIKFRTFAIGYVLVLAVYLFAKGHASAARPENGFSKVVDLTRPELQPHDPEATILEAPANYAFGPRTDNQIPANRLTAPLVVLDIESEMRNDPGHQVSVEDIADWELAHGEVPPNAIVIAHTGLSPHAAGNFPGYSMDAAQFLVEGRDILAIGSDTPTIDSSRTKSVGHYALAHSVCRLENVANLEKASASGSIITAFVRQQHRGRTPVQLLAMVR